MPNAEIFTDTDLTNMVRGFDAPAREDLMEKLLSQAKERDQEANEQAEDNSLEDFYRRKDESKNRDLDNER